MSSEITKLRDGVQLRKRFEDEEFHLPSVVYEFESERADVVAVRVEERLPDSIGPEHIGFHNDIGRDNWELTENSIVCEATIEPGGECEAVYALRPEREYDPDQLTREPGTFTVSQSPSAVVSADQSEAFTRSAGPDDDAAGSDVDREVATWDDDGTDGGTTEGDTADGETAGGDATDGHGVNGATAGTTQSDGPASLVDELVAELRDGTASEESRQYLEQAFGSGSLPPGSVDARITQLQADVSDLEAYRNAMEEFLDAYGSPEQVTDTLESRLDAFEAELHDVGSTAADAEAELSSLHDRLRTVEDELDSMSEELSAVGTDVEELSAELSRLDEQASTEGVEERLAEVEAELEEVCDFTDALEKAVQQ